MLVRGNRLPEVGCQVCQEWIKTKSLLTDCTSILYVSCDVWIFTAFTNELVLTHSTVLLLLFVDLARRETLHLPLTQHSLENKHALLCMWKDCLIKEDSRR